jgi:hypothetical protein
MLLWYGPVSIQGRYGDIRVKVWHGKRSKDLELSAQAARRLAFVLLLEAEKLEAAKFHANGLYTPKTIERPIDRAIDSMVRLQKADEKLRDRDRKRKDREYFRRLGKPGK